MQLWLFVVIGCIFPALSAALKCYQCNSVMDKKGCGAPVDDKYLIDCKENESCMVGSGKAQDVDFVSRACFPHDKEECVDQEIGPGGEKGRVCFCKKDKCNSSNVLLPSLAVYLSIYFVIVCNCFWLS